MTYPTARQGDVSVAVLDRVVNSTSRIWIAAGLAVAVLIGLERAQADQIVVLAAKTSAAAFVLASLLAWLVAGRVLRPVRQVSSLANGIISESDLSRRIPVTGADEISQLAATFNRMLDRLSAAFEAQRAFVNDAVHELRTPITVIRGYLDIPSGDRAERARTQVVVLACRGSTASPCWPNCAPPGPPFR